MLVAGREYLEGGTAAAAAGEEEVVQDEMEAVGDVGPTRYETVTLVVDRDVSVGPEVLPAGVIVDVVGAHWVRWQEH